MIEYLPLDQPLQDSLNLYMNYMSEYTSKVTTWYEIIFRPKDPVIHHPLFFYKKEADAFICFLVSQQATFLPDWLSKIIQIYGNINVSEDTINLCSYQELIYELLLIFMKLCQFRMFMTMWLIFNPYAQPWILVTTATDWFLEILSGSIPSLMGIEFTGSIMLNLLSQFIQYIRNLVFTMPYLPSEGIKETIGFYDMYRFNGFPRLWYENGIPDQLREEWYTKKPEIIKHFLTYYNDIGQDIVPSRILEEYYNNHIRQVNIINSSINYDNFLINAFSYAHNMFHLDLPINQIKTVSDNFL